MLYDRLSIKVIIIQSTFKFHTKLGMPSILICLILLAIVVIDLLFLIKSRYTYFAAGHGRCFM